MALSDPFGITFEGARQGLSSFGDALNLVAQQYAQRQKEKQLRQRAMSVFPGIIDLETGQLNLEAAQKYPGLEYEPMTGETRYKVPQPLFSLDSLIPLSSKNNEEGFGTQLSGIRYGKPTFTQDTPGEIFKRASSLREEFINRPEVKEYVTINTNVKSMDSLLKGALSGDIENKVALDQGLITMYNKLTDPQSVVRESEYSRTPGNLPLVNRFSGAILKVKQGGAGLTDDDRKALVWGAKVIANERGKTFNETLTGYRDLSKEAKVKESSVLRGFKEHENFSIGLEGNKQSLQGQTSKGTTWKKVSE